MSRYKIDKSVMHDYATLDEKISNKLRTVFYKLIKDRTKAYPFYRSYRHRNHVGSGNDANNTSHFMTEAPNSLAGFGHGLGSWRSGLVNADRLGMNYAYSPMVNKSWDEKMGLGEGFSKASELLASGYKKIRLPYYDMDDPESIKLVKKIIDSYKGEKVVFFNEHEQWTADGDEIYGDLLIRDLFWKSSTRKRDNVVYKNDGAINVALHIRRGDVKALLEQGDKSMLARWLDNSYYASVMNKIIDCAGNADKVHFYIFSEGDKHQFDDLAEITPNMEVLTDLSAEDSFVNLCHADIIVTAPSSFSIMAGAYSYALKLYPDKDWLTIPETEEWQIVSCDGRISNATEAAICERMSTFLKN